MIPVKTDFYGVQIEISMFQWTVDLTRQSLKKARAQH